MTPVAAAGYVGVVTGVLPPPHKPECRPQWPVDHAVQNGAVAGTDRLKLMTVAPLSTAALIPAPRSSSRWHWRRKRHGHNPDGAAAARRLRIAAKSSGPSPSVREAAEFVSAAPARRVTSTRTVKLAAERLHPVSSGRRRHAGIFGRHRSKVSERGRRRISSSCGRPAVVIKL